MNDFEGVAMNNPTCSVDGCEKPKRKTSLCDGHYAQKRRGAPLSPLRTVMPRGATNEDRFWSSVEKTGTCWNWTASTDGKGYGKLYIDGKLTPAHRYSYSILKGCIPGGLMVDHQCHNRRCVNPDHLRLATAKQNQEHRAKAAVNNQSSGVRGVTWHKGQQCWQAQVGHAGKYYYCGGHATVALAEAAVIAKRIELSTHNDVDRSLQPSTR